jgi:putative ABC transport system ATP-binding protein
MIETRDLSRVFRTEAAETTALREVSVSVGAREFVAVTGPTGCGKSTLLNILGLLDSPTAGQYRFLGEDVSHLSDKRRSWLRKANIGFVFQSSNLIDELTVLENVELPLLYLELSFSERRRRVNTALERMGLVTRRHQFPHQLSGGQQQRTAVARAVVTGPRLILADEPTGNLDSTHGDEVMNLLTELHQEGTTIIMVTHSAAYADYAERLLHLFDGQLVAENLNDRLRL